MSVAVLPNKDWWGFSLTSKSEENFILENPSKCEWCNWTRQILSFLNFLNKTFLFEICIFVELSFSPMIHSLIAFWHKLLRTLDPMFPIRSLGKIRKRSESRLYSFYIKMKIQNVFFFIKNRISHQYTGNTLDGDQNP